MFRGRLAGAFVAFVAVLPALASNSLDEREYLPDVMQHLSRAKMALDAGQYNLAIAHTQIVLHDSGLKVYLDLSETPSNLEGDCRKAAAKSLDYWNGKLGPNSLTLVEDTADADVRIVFRKEVELRDVQVAGWCSQSRSVTGSATGEASVEYKATIQARTQWPGGRSMSADYLRNIVTHELGHVYGLEDCTEPGHLMSAMSANRARFELGAEEWEALQQLRLTAFDTQRAILARSKGN